MSIGRASRAYCKTLTGADRARGKQHKRRNPHWHAKCQYEVMDGVICVVAVRECSPVFIGGGRPRYRHGHRTNNAPKMPPMILNQQIHSGVVAAANFAMSLLGRLPMSKRMMKAQKAPA